jgi:hypothetical protein
MAGPGRIETSRSTAELGTMSVLSRKYSALMTAFSVPNRIIFYTAVIVVPALLIGSTANADLSAQQAEMDAACEQARERRLAPEREKYIAECIEKKQRQDRAACERFYSDYGAQSGNRAPLYYDLPECVKAFEFRRNNK